MKLILALTCLILTSCAFLQSPKGQKLLTDAETILGKAAVASLASLASSNGDYAHSAAQAAWQSVSINDLFTVIKDAGASSKLAQAASIVAAKAVGGGASQSDVLMAIGAAISPATK